MNIALWIVQGAAALGFVYSDWLKTFQYEKAIESWGWVKDVPKSFVVFIGLAELLGVLGILLPQAANIAPLLYAACLIGEGKHLGHPTLLFIQKTDCPQYQAIGFL